MSNLGFHSLFYRVSTFHGIRACRFFIENSKLFSPDLTDPHRRDSSPGKAPTLAGFDVVFFTVSFELDYFNILKMLILSSIPPLREERKAKRPIVMIGGITVTANPEVLSPFADVIYRGDMEISLDAILRIFMEFSFQKSRGLFQELARLEGVYIPGQRDKAPKKAFIKEIKEPAHSVILSKNTEFSNMFLIEIGRGCRNSCKFCMTKCAASPFRSIKREYILSTLEKECVFTERVGLIAPVLTDHPELDAIVHTINEAGFAVSFSSLRADDFHEETARLLSENHQTTVTFAPETGSSELRKKIGKRLTNEALLRAVELAQDYGIKRFRYYIMYGLPGEKERDINAVVGLIKMTLQLLAKRGSMLHVSINPFVPKKGTAFEKCRLFPFEYYKKTAGLLKDELSGLRNLSLRTEPLRTLYLQYYLSIGNNAIGLLLYQCVEKGTTRGFVDSAEEVMEKIDGL